MPVLNKKQTELLNNAKALLENYQGNEDNLDAPKGVYTLAIVGGGQSIELQCGRGKGEVIVNALGTHDLPSSLKKGYDALLVERDKVRDLETELAKLTEWKDEAEATTRKLVNGIFENIDKYGEVSATYLNDLVMNVAALGGSYTHPGVSVIVNYGQMVVKYFDIVFSCNVYENKERGLPGDIRESRGLNYVSPAEFISAYMVERGVKSCLGHIDKSWFSDGLKSRNQYIKVQAGVISLCEVRKGHVLTLDIDTIENTKLTIGCGVGY